ncbi:Rho termination factor N-terminal domain-containing protein [Kamptonema sp. UHCC 0994]|uniref:Rho termination factor N-terminal domain-containing protein n=1 Tax=Kamptonema sp. UHCC 0994 TaxID=3031329 RepID=UPI0023BA8E94|nr:Rho termination factor N-terminal domain-containing protein [Kamptonema sp. UHCC 0994]MDF0556803.1 Rho termination factor N-terminal domain-containing protein [Kamptonema sp. UHCC 0994]
MDRSDTPSRIIEYLRIKPISHSQIYTFQIAIPESQQEEIPQERREALRISLIEQGSNLIPLIIRRTEAYSNEEEYEVVCGADWCIVAKELGIEHLWAWVFEMTDEEATIAKTQMEQLVAAPAEGRIQIKSLLQQLEVSFQEKVENLTKKIEQSVKKNEDLLKKQVKALTERNPENDEIEQIKNLLAKIEKTFHEKVDNLAKKIEQPGNTSSFSIASEVNQEDAIGQLEELEKLIERKLEGTVREINQYVSESIKGVKNDIKNQIEAILHQLQITTKLALKPKSEPETEPELKPKARSRSQSKSEPKTQPKSQSKTPPQLPQDDYESLSLRKLKAIGKELKLRGYARMKRPEILAALQKEEGK